MFRLAGYQVFCWLALAFMTLSGTSSRAAFVVIGVGLAATGLGVVIQLAAIRRVTTPRRQT